MVPTPPHSGLRVTARLWQGVRMSVCCDGFGSCRRLRSAVDSALLRCLPSRSMGGHCQLGARSPWMFVDKSFITLDRSVVGVNWVSWLFQGMLRCEKQLAFCTLTWRWHSFVVKSLGGCARDLRYHRIQAVESLPYLSLAVLF